MNVEDVKKLTVEKLKVELKSRDLDTTGKKAELAERLEAHLQAQPEPSAQANGASTSAPAPASSAAPASGKARKPIVWSAASADGAAAGSEAPTAATTAATTAAADPAAAEPSDTDAAETDLPAEASEEEKRKARAKKFGIVDATAPAKESVKRKAEDPEAVALVSDDIVAKRQARFKTAEESAEEQRRQRFMDPDAIKAKERKERFEKWLPQDSGKNSKDDVAAAISTSLDSSVAAKGRGRGKPNAAAPKEEKYSAEFMAKAEARKARFAGKK